MPKLGVRQLAMLREFAVEGHTFFVSEEFKEPDEPVKVMRQLVLKGLMCAERRTVERWEPSAKRTNDAIAVGKWGRNESILQAGLTDAGRAVLVEYIDD